MSSNDWLKKLKITPLEYIKREYKEDLLSRLRGEVFHLTSEQSFEKIKNDGFIFHNREGRFELNTSSENSFGREQGWICLFDLRDKSDEEIEETLTKYYFLGPSWFCEYEIEFSQMKLAYLILDCNYYDKLILNEAARKSLTEKRRPIMYVPGTECWYPGDLPLSFIRETILVNIVQDAPKHNRFAYMHHLDKVINKSQSNMK